MAEGNIFGLEDFSGGGSSAIAETLGLYIDNEGYLCQRVEEAEENNG